MRFLKRHYEKILLSVVLLALAGASVWLILRAMAAQEEMQEERERMSKGAKKQRPPAAFDSHQAVLQRGTNPPPVSLALPHWLFNPVRWDKQPDGKLIKVKTGEEVGAGALVVTKVTPLSTIIAFGGASGTGEKTRYRIDITREAAADPKDRRKIQIYAAKGEKTKEFDLAGQKATLEVKEIKGDVADPTELVLELSAGPRAITVSKTQPFTEVTDYAADLVYPPEGNKAFNGVRMGADLDLPEGKYKIVAITEKLVVVSAPNGKRTSRPNSATP